MAFEFNSEKSNNIKKALGSSKPGQNLNDNKIDNENIAIKEIKIQPAYEVKQRYNIMLDPSVKQKADRIAKEKNFKSTSSFLNELIKSL